MPTTITAPVKLTQQPLNQRIQPPLWAKLARHLLWGVFTVIAALFALEGIFALAHLGEENYIQIEPIVGTLHMPNKAITFRQEGYSHFVINSDGFRDKERTVIKPAGVKRIVALGDSMIEGFQVQMDKTCTAFLEQELNKKWPGKFEVMNGAVSGYSTVQNLYLLKEKLLKYHPDVCIVEYHCGDNEKNILTDYVKYDLPRPYCGLDEKNRLYTDWSVYDGSSKSANAAFFSSTAWLRRHSRLWDIFTQAELQLVQFKQYEQVRSQIFKLAGKLQKTESAPVSDKQPEHRITDTSADILGTSNPDASTFVDLDSVIPQPPLFKEFPMGSYSNAKTTQEVTAIRYESASWRAIQGACRKRFWVTTRLLEEFNALCKAHDCKLVVLGLPGVNNSMLYFKELQFVRNLAKAHDFVFVDANETFPDISPAHSNDFYYSLHFNNAGHSLIAKALYKGLTEGGLIP
jgi:hypothetical protein